MGTLCLFELTEAIIAKRVKGRIVGRRGVVRDPFSESPAMLQGVRMPHVIVEGPASLERLYRSFAPETVREGACILKLRGMYANAACTEALIECVVVEDGLPQTFYALLSQRSSAAHGAAITVRLDPLTDPQKTAGVKRLLALLGRRLKAQDPACRYGATNLTDYLEPDA